MSETFRIHGRIFVTLETVARCYEVEHAWLEEARELGLLDPVERVEGRALVAAAALERVAVVLRLQRQQGLNLAGAVSLLRVGRW